MAVTVDSSGDDTSITAGGGATSLGSSTTAGVFQLVLDTNNLANGDVLEVNVYDKVLSGSTARVVFNAVYANAQGEKIKVSPPIMVSHYFEVQLTLTGSTRTFDWEFRRA
jgi:hypothetical protein